VELVTARSSSITTQLPVSSIAKIDAIVSEIGDVLLTTSR
jgi:hypothetical protein